MPGRPVAARAGIKGVAVLNKDEIIGLLNTMIEKNCTIAYEKIPEIDLYMDQLTTFMDDKLKDYKRKDDDKILTKTMINNYSKDKVLPPPINKKYSKEHMVLLIMIYHLKSGLAISDIAAFYEYLNGSGLPIENIYNNFTALQNMENETLLDGFSQKLDSIEDRCNFDNKQDLAVSVILDLIIDSNNKRHLAEKMIDELCGNIKAHSK